MLHGGKYSKERFGGEEIYFKQSAFIKSWLDRRCGSQLWINVVAISNAAALSCRASGHYRHPMRSRRETIFNSLPICLGIVIAIMIAGYWACRLAMWTTEGGLTRWLD